MVKSTEPTRPAAWLLMAVGDDRQHGCNDGYDDDPNCSYTWDETVPNHAKLAVGDRIALWDKHHLLGVSVVEEISVEDNVEKIVHRCPECGKANLKARKKLSPKYRCFKCKAEFNKPKSSVRQVRQYKSRHDAAWVDLDGALSGKTIRNLCFSPDAQLSLRALNWDALVEALHDHPRYEDVKDWTSRRQLASDGDGHQMRMTRVRVGQAAFRARTLARYGGVCAISGPAPLEVLDAAHLYSYADIGTHYEHGGLMLRRDVHFLFDSGRICIEPALLTLDVDSTMSDYPSYAKLHGQPLHVREITAAQRKWLSAHWQQHRS